MKSISSLAQLILLVILTATLLSFGMLGTDRPSDNIFDQNVLEWDENRKLEWADFKTKKIKSNISALTASGIEYYYECDDNELTVHIKAIFIPTESWVRYNSKTEYILAHEQLHFDITELYARKFRKEFLNANINCSNIKALNKLAERILMEWESEQARYDKESRHSIDEGRQAYWNEKINRELKLTSAYTNKMLSN